jgi:16S rRNA (adenine1518-N6/adenine1519-N6)-dimethyltransferase
MVPRTQIHGPRARKSLGQHFLRDSGVLADIAAAVGAPAGGLVVEVGAGTGQLTAALLERGYDVLALEIEDRLVGYLRRRFAGNERLRVVLADARDAVLTRWVSPGREFWVAGNLPYFAANPIVRRFLEMEPRPAGMVVMVQREVAREMAAEPGAYSLLSVAVQVYARAEVLFDVRPEAFDPPPKVHSSVVRLELRPQPLVAPERMEGFFDFVSRTFRNPRKQVHNALARGTWLSPEEARSVLAEVGIDPTRRSETLTIEEWLALLEAAEGMRTDG